VSLGRISQLLADQRGQGMAGDHLRLLRRRTISPGDLRRNPALLVDEHGWPEEKKERLKSLNLEGMGRSPSPENWGCNDGLPAN
jgi:hypothetical protein